ncbi:MAG: hypothetical protein E7142_02315 [Rikenellaceae bacterium]|nr:hypothetical protein [Rikenellaceae bacterium]
MSCNHNCTKKHIPEPGRGFTVCDCTADLCVEPVEGCYKLHETPWLEEYPDNIPTDIFEVRFKNTRRSYYKNVNNLQLKRGDIVAVEASPGHDIGIVSLTGDMVAKQIRRTGFTPFNGEYKKIYRKAKPYDIERWQEAIALEHDTMIQSRQIAAEMGLDMKIGDVEYQGDKIKAIFYYIAEGRVDFRELIKVFAERFHIRIEMKQIGARQEAGRIGGIGACGRELCCASWVSSFSSVTTNAARVQDISLNPQKLAGQCSKLKCCLMYEYDVYADARQKLPRVREPLQAMDGEYYLVKTDILGRTMSFSSSKDAMVNVVTIPTSRVREIIAANRAGRKVESIIDKDNMPTVEEPTFRTEEDSITRFDNQNKRRRNRNRRDKDSRQRQPKAVDAAATPQEGEQPQEERRRDDRRRQRPNRQNRHTNDNQENNAQQAESNNAEPRESREPRENRERRDRRRNNRGRGRGEWHKREGEKGENSGNNEQ